MRWAPGWDIPGTDILWPEQRESVRQMIQSFTINGAKADLKERVSGSIEKGQRADPIVLSHNILKVAPKDIGKVNVTMTLFRGKVVHRTK